MAKVSNEQRTRNRQESIERLTFAFKEELGKRVTASKALFAKTFNTKVANADLHSHSEHTDGQSTIAENADQAKRAGIDMLFATDHWTLAPKRQAVAQKGMSWGIEGSCYVAHIGLLHATEPAPDCGDVTIAQGVEKLRKISPFVWVTHPTGFGPVTGKWFKTFFDRMVDIDNLAMEILNGYDSLTRSYERTGRWNAELMDMLLGAGRTVTAIGSSDAHSLIEIGNSWTGVIGATKSPNSIIKGLQAGNCFASEAPMLDFTLNGKPMGATLKPRKGTALKLRVRAADTLGVALVRVISDGKIIKEFDARRADTFEGTLTRKATGRPASFRIEVVAIDNRYAFSTPIYIR
jgi:hypothetical protein